MVFAFLFLDEKILPSSGSCSRTRDTGRPSKDHSLGGLCSSSCLVRLSPESTTFRGDSFQVSPLLGSASSLTHGGKVPARALSSKTLVAHECRQLLESDGVAARVAGLFSSYPNSLLVIAYHCSTCFFHSTYYEVCVYMCIIFFLAFPEFLSNDSLLLQNWYACEVYVHVLCF